MSIGVVCEYNPMHFGHLYQINEIKKKYPNDIIIIVTCGCFTERGEVCVVNKWDKTKTALNNGVDIVIELPFVFSTQSADIFAHGAISILNKLKVDRIIFGSESNDIIKIENIVKTQLFNKEYNNVVKKYLDSGTNYPTAMSNALNDILGYTLNDANDLLGISYVKEILKNNYNIKYECIKRTNSYFDKNISSNNIASGSKIRSMINKGDNVSKYIVDYKKIKIYNDANINNVYSVLKYLILTHDISNIQTVDEGIENRVVKSSAIASSYDELIFKIKTKRYTYNKISRMLLHILCNFTKDDAKRIDIDYIRLLGFSINGQKYLNSVKKDIDIPIITSYKKNISMTFDIEYRINYIYSMIVDDENLIKFEKKCKPIIKKDV